MTKYPIRMRVKQDGKIHAVGTNLEFPAGEIASLVANGVLDDPNIKGDDAGSNDNFDLGDELAKLISEGHEIKTMTMADINKLLSQNAIRAQVNEALQNIVADNQKIENVEAVISVIKAKADGTINLINEDGQLDGDKVKELLKSSGEYSPETVNAAIAAINLETENQ